MAFTENLDQFFSTDDFGVTAIFTLSNSTTRSVNVIFDTPTQSINIYETEIEADAPFLRCKTADVAGIKTNDTVVISGTSYTVKKKTQDDGTGVSLVYLKT